MKIRSVAGTAGTEIERRKFEEVTVSIDPLPEGILVPRKVAFLDGTAAPPWIRPFDESNILIHGNCLYYLEDSPMYRGGYGWDTERRQLGADFRKALRTGDALPDVCFPLRAGKTWGDPKKGRDLGTVAGLDRHSWRLAAHLFSGDDNYVWFRPGVGITGARTYHRGTYHEERVRLLRFRPLSSR
jgi:hypothetical protein